MGGWVGVMCARCCEEEGGGERERENARCPLIQPQNSLYIVAEFQMRACVCVSHAYREFWCVCVSMCVYVYVCVCHTGIVYIDRFWCVCVYLSVCVVCACVRVCMCACVELLMCVMCDCNKAELLEQIQPATQDIYTYKCVCVCACVCVCVCVCVLPLKYIYIYIYV